ncbi:MAG: hypothetical protein V9G11_00075 [Bifidobacterium adolescentis]
MWDGQEVTDGSDPLDACDPDDTAAPCDRDNDGLENLLEELIGTDPDNPDTDGEMVSLTARTRWRSIFAIRRLRLGRAIPTTTALPMTKRPPLEPTQRTGIPTAISSVTVPRSAPRLTPSTPARRTSSRPPAMKTTTPAPIPWTRWQPPPTCWPAPTAGPFKPGDTVGWTLSPDFAAGSEVVLAMYSIPVDLFSG